MFAMLSGRWPRILADGTRLATLEAGVRAGRLPATDLHAALERAVDEVIGAQLDAGIGLVHDGGVRWADPWRAVAEALDRGDTGSDGLLARAWRGAVARVASGDVAVAAVVPGPWTLAVDEAGVGSGDAAGIARRAAARADALAGELEALGAAGCPVVVVEEPAVIGIGDDEVRRAGFRDAQARLLSRARGLHAMLAVTGGSAAGAGVATVLDAPYASFLFDLSAGPDNWTLVRAVPAERGIVVAALEAGGGRERRDQAPELVWAAQYAASGHGRGLARVGLANATPLDGLGLDEARAALAALGRAATLASMPVAEAVRAGLDPRAIPRGPVPAPGALPVPPISSDPSPPSRPAAKERP